MTQTLGSHDTSRPSGLGFPGGGLPGGGFPGGGLPGGSFNFSPGSFNFGSRSTQDRQAALRRAIARIEQEKSQSGGGGTLAGIDTTTAVLGAGVAASLVLALRSRSK